MAIPRDAKAECDDLANLAEKIDGAGDGERARVLTEQLGQRLYIIADRPLATDLLARLRSHVGRYWLGLRLMHHRDGLRGALMEAIWAGGVRRPELWIAEHPTQVSTEMQSRLSVHYLTSQGRSRPCVTHLGYRVGCVHSVHERE